MNGRSSALALSATIQLAATVFLTLGLCTCIIPDRDIILEGAIQNHSPVRIVERLVIPIPDALNQACKAVTGNTEISCPQPPSLLSKHFLAENLTFCSCDKSKGEYDHEPGLGNFSIYIEDGDLDENGEPKDEIYVALLLDAERNISQPAESLVDYARYLDASSPIGLAFGTNYDARLQDYGRARPGLREVNIRDVSTITQQFVDLCNGNQGPNPLDVGFHTLMVLATDRPWFTLGVPDIAGGATYDTQTYTFYCHDRGSDQCVGRCTKSDEEAP